MKNAFISVNLEEINKIKSFLTSNNIDVTVEHWNNVEKHLIAVNEADYYKTLKYGSLYIMKNKFCDVCWISPDNWCMRNMYDLAVLSKQDITDKEYMAEVSRFDPRKTLSKTNNKIEEMQF